MSLSSTIDRRCEDMVIKGLLDEVAQLLLDKHIWADSMAGKAIGYRQVSFF